MFRILINQKCLRFKLPLALKAYNDNLKCVLGKGGDKLAKCPNCGAEVTTPIKEWDVSPKLHVKMYEHCGKKFRKYGK